MEKKTKGNFLNRIRHSYFLSIHDTCTTPSRNTEGSTGEALSADLPSWQSQSWLTCGSMFSPSAGTCWGGCRSWQDSWAPGLLCSTAAGNPQCFGRAVPWLPNLPGTAASAHRHAWGSPGQQVKAATAPVWQAALGSPGRGLQLQNHSCATAAWNCKPTRTHWLLWAAPGSTRWFPAQPVLGEGGLHITLGEKLRDQGA